MKGIPKVNFLFKKCLASGLKGCLFLFVLVCGLKYFCVVGI